MCAVDPRLELLEHYLGSVRPNRAMCWATIIGLTLSLDEQDGAVRLNNDINKARFANKRFEILAADDTDPVGRIVSGQRKVHHPASPIIPKQRSHRRV